MRPSVRAALVGALIINLALFPSLGAASRKDPGPTGLTDATQIALGYVEARRGALGLTRADVEGIVVTDSYRSPHNGLAHVYLGQTHRRLDVVGPAMTVNVSRNGRVIHAPARLMGNVAAAASGQVELTATEAVERAADVLELGVPGRLEVLERAGGVERLTLLSRGGISLRPIAARLVYQPTGGGRARLAWQVQIDDVSEQHMWVASVDAETGSLLRADDLVVHDNAEATAAAVSNPSRKPAPTARLGPEPTGDGASYRVYALPFESPNDGPRTLVESPADAVGSPFGWHDTDGSPGAEATTTRGNNVHAYVDPIPAGNSALPLMDADCGANLACDFPIDFNLPPTAWKDAAVANLFYWNNIIHDVFYRYGFTEAAGNFQTNNYEKGGQGGDYVQAEAQDGSGTNNANFGTPADGSRPRMQMYVWPNFGQRRIIDGDLDSGVITHEYGHGISNRLTGGPDRVDCLRNQEQMGEGWSDWLAIALTALPSDTGEGRRGMGTYVLGQENRQGAGIRPRPYSTNMSTNNATYDTIKTSAVPHGVGYVWATMLWEVYWGLVDEHGFNPDVYGDWTTGGNNLAIQLVMDGMKLQPCSPGFVDGRNAILAANAALVEGDAEAVNHCIIWRAFAKRGLGLGAEQGSSTSRSDGTQSFDLPTECAA